jgi:hypothetical protein
MATALLMASGSDKVNVGEIVVIVVVVLVLGLIGSWLLSRHR